AGSPRSRAARCGCTAPAATAPRSPPRSSTPRAGSRSRSTTPSRTPRRWACTWSAPATTKARTPEMTLLLAVVAGLLIGLSLGALGGGGSILAVPVLVYLLDQTATQATTGSLVVVGVTSLTGALAAQRAGNVLLGRGAVFGAVGIGGAALGAKGAAYVDDDVLLAAFATLMLIVGGVMAWRQLHHGRRGAHAARPGLDDPIISFSPTFACNCPRALKVLITATAVGLLTGFLGVG